MAIAGGSCGAGQTSGSGSNRIRLPARAEVAVLVALALAVRALIAARTVVPARDGATYLWMAEQVARGDVGAAFRTVFHPLYPLLAGGVLAVLPGLTPFAAGQIVAAVAGAVAVWPLHALAHERFGAAEARGAAVLYALGLWFVRHPAECLSEGCFYLAAAGWAWAVLGERSRPGLAGIAASVAYATRPEGLLLLWLGALRLRGAARAHLLAVGVLCSAVVPLGYAVLGDGLTLTPKAAFNYAVGIGAHDSALRHYLQHAVRVPGTAFEAVGYAALPLAAFGAWLAWSRRDGRRAAALLVAPFLVQMLVVPMLRSHARFLSGFGVLLLPLAGSGLAALLAHARGQARWLPACLLLVAFAPDLLRLPARRGEERRIERALGEWLRPRLRPGDFIATEMPRLEFFAGQRPRPPRALTRAEVMQAAARPDARFVVVVARRSEIVAADLEQLGLRLLSLPEHLSVLANERGLLVYERP